MKSEDIRKLNLYTGLWNFLLKMNLLNPGLYNTQPKFNRI